MSEILDKLSALFYSLRHEAVITEEGAKQNPKSRCRRASQRLLPPMLVNKESKGLPSRRCGVQRKINRQLNLLARCVAMCALLFSPCVAVHGGLLKADVDFSNYDVPLYQQIVN